MNPSILMVDARVRYWEDAIVNCYEDVAGSLIPCREGNSWKPSIELATGKILGWPVGTTADIHYKVCDDGDYWLADSEGNKLYKWAGDYVPDRLLCVGESGYGDYIILKVREDGRIADWFPPLVDTGEWVRLYPLNQPLNTPAQVAIAAKETDSSGGSRQLVIDPDMQADFTALPFPDESFSLVVFDPPHLIRNGKKGWLAKKYGKLEGDWREELRKGFAECFRVLRSEGTLIFKWNEHEVPVSQILALTPERPLIGNRCGKTSKSHWIVFCKPNNV